MFQLQFDQIGQPIWLSPSGQEMTFYTESGLAKLLARLPRTLKLGNPVES